MKPLIMTLLLAAVTPAAAQTPYPIRLGDPPAERVVSPGKPQAYVMELGARWFVRGEANQLSADVVVRIIDPAGRVLGVFDNPARGPEPFHFITEQAGEHRIEVAAFERDSGAFTLQLRRVEPLATTPEGRVDQALSDYDRSSPGAVVAVVRNGAIAFVRG